LIFDEQIEILISHYDFGLEKAFEFNQLINKDIINTQQAINLGEVILENKDRV
jgi:hypothetical protein